MKSKPSPAPWIVRPDYGKENVYRLWDKNTNYHDDTSPERMDANANLMSFSPRLFTFVSLVARMKTENEFGEDTPASEDWIATLNSLIVSARAIVGNVKG